MFVLFLIFPSILAVLGPRNQVGGQRQRAVQGRLSAGLKRGRARPLLAHLLHQCRKDDVGHEWWHGYQGKLSLSRLPSISFVDNYDLNWFKPISPVSFQDNVSRISTASESSTGSREISKFVQVGGLRDLQ